MIILDELPTKSILDGRGGVDRDLFPGFGELAGTATWYRNNTTVAPLTPEAIPPILTGRYADHDALPVAAEYPRNLFSLLRGTYDIHASEAQSFAMWREPAVDRSRAAIPCHHRVGRLARAR
jgi:hypothetical protein